MNLVVSIERSGKMVRVGTISGRNSAAACFRYDEEYAAGPNAAAISISLPLQTEAFSPELTKSFFEGLLPEGFTRRSVAAWLHTDENDFVAILHALGRECLGAVRIHEEGEESAEAYEEISSEEVRELAEEGADKSAEIVVKSHLSLTGASGKVGLYYHGDDKWYLPVGTAPSTHIVKQSHVRLRNIVANEQLSLMTAKRCGIEVPDSFILNTGAGRDSEVLFATRRFDRVFTEDALMIDGLEKPLRLHQEDFAQALGIPAALKYENEPSGYLKKMFDILRIYSADPVADQLKLWDRIIFNYLIGNTDAHIKNFSLLYGPDLRSVRLAPAYDILSTAVYEQSTRNMAFRIGKELSVDRITAQSFRDAAEEIGIGSRMAMRRFERMCGLFEEALHKSALQLYDEGFENAPELEQRILHKNMEMR